MGGEHFANQGTNMRQGWERIGESEEPTLTFLFSRSFPTNFVPRAFFRPSHFLGEKALVTKLLRNPAACLHKIVSQG